jgi:hypothetical protein
MKKKEQNPWDTAYELNKDKYTREEIGEMLFCEITELLEQTEQKEEEKDITPWRGTSYHGDCFLATINELKEIFGSPDRVGDKEDKVQYEWLLDLEISNTLKTSAPITIYDWKEYRNYHVDDYIRFHIGGFSNRITRLAKKEIEKILTIFENEDTN